MMNKKIKKILIIQLSILEIILILSIIGNEQNKCAIETSQNNLLVYNYNEVLLSPKYGIKEVEVTTEEKNEEETSENETETVEEIIEEIIPEPEPTPVYYYEPAPVTPVAIHDVDYTVAESLVEYAKQFEGYPYVYGGNSLTGGTDCSGFTKLIYAEYGVELPRVAYDQQFSGYEVPLDQIQIGDLVLSGYEGKTHHASIYIGNGQLVHALNANVGIVITDLYIMPITHVRRVL